MQSHRYAALLALVIPFVGLVANPRAVAEPQVEGKSPDEALRTIQARRGFKVNLVAAEPLVQDPIAFAWGADGKFWVVEMGDYPLGVDGHGKSGGRVKVLTDPDERGR